VKGRRDKDCDWPPELGLAILEARRPLYEQLSHLVGLPEPHLLWRNYNTLAAFMGMSYEAVRQIESKALRKLRIVFLYRQNELTEELRDALRGYGRNGTASH